MSFSQLKKSSKSQFKALAERMAGEGKRTSFDDDRYWKPEVDKAGSRICYHSFSSSD